MKFTGIALVSTLAALSAAKKCTELKVPVTATARNGVFRQPIPRTKAPIVDF